jgi:hypothetical protein
VIPIAGGFDHKKTLLNWKSDREKKKNLESALKLIWDSGTIQAQFALRKMAVALTDKAPGDSGGKPARRVWQKIRRL